MVDKFFYRLTVVMLVVMSIAIIAGCVYSADITSSDSAELSGYIGDVLNGFDEKQNDITKNVFFRWISLWGIVAVSGFFLPGAIINAMVLTKRGFLIGYILGCYYKIYTLKGIFMCLAMLPETLITIPGLVVFSSISLKMSVLRYENKKKLLKKYFLVCIIFLAIFSIISLFQSYLTTIFMKIFYNFIL